MPSVDDYPRGAENPIKKKSSMRSIFSIFRSKSTTGISPQRSHPEKDTIQTTLSFESFPQTPTSPYGNLDMASIPAASSPISSSSSSASSLEFASDASTAATTPSTSSPSVVMKGLDSACAGSTSSLAENTTAVPPRRPQPAKKPSWTVPENHRKRSSPLSNMEASSGPLLSLYPLPSPPPSPVLHDRRNSAMPKRRNSLGRLLSRGYQSNPDLAGMSDSDEGAVPAMMPTLPFSNPSSAGAPSRARNLRRKEKGRADIEKPTSYTEQEKMEHESILGADPAGYGFYLYPKTSTTISRRNSYAGPSDGGSGVDGGSGRASHSRRTWKEAKGRNLRRTMTSQVIVEEECGDEAPAAAEAEAAVVQPQRRHSMMPGVGVGSQWRASRQDAAAAPAATPAGRPGANDTRRRSFQNNWDQLSAQIERHDGPFPPLDGQQKRRNELQGREQAALRQLQLEDNRFMIRCDDIEDDDDFGVKQTAEKTRAGRSAGRSAGKGRNGNAQLPALRVEVVNV